MSKHHPDQSTKPETKYDYQSRQESILLPYYRRLLWNSILNALPMSLSPNAMTLISTAACASSFALAAIWGDDPIAMLLAAALVLTYLTLDNLDGAQARRIGRSSRLGEFLDHWLDTLNNGFVVLGACLAAGLPTFLTLAVISCGSLAFFSVQWELRRTGIFRMGRVADIEGNTSAALLYVALAIFGSEAFRVAPVPGLPSLAVLMGCSVMAQAIWTLLSAVHRVKGGRADFAPIVIAHAIILFWAGSGAIGAATYLSLAFFANPVFTTRCICGRLIDRSTPKLDWIVVAGLFTAAGSSFGAGSASLSSTLGVLAVLGLAAVTALHLVVAVMSLRMKSTSLRESRGAA